MRGETKWRL
ncbi:Protein of unknown function [Bacillus cytotoxicus]|nr:Protein of unknown function [Bacillus cytotoxicus]